MPDFPDTVRLEEVACPLSCAAGDVLVLRGGDRLHGVAGHFTVLKCRRCGLMRTTPRPTPDTISIYYPGEYAPYRDAPLPAAAAGGGTLKRLLGLDGRRTPPMPAGQLLEIGCAAGSYLEKMRREGWAVRGIEFSAEAAAQAQSKQMDVQVATVESAQPPSQPVDLIAAWMVLEHLHEPVEALRRMRSWITPGGYLIGSVPDAGSVERRVFRDRWYALQLPTHLFHYSPESLRQVLAASGWRLTHLWWQRNCINLLWSLEYTANDWRMPRLARAVRWFRTSRAMGKPRALLGWLLGATRQSGRLEFWAQPIEASEQAGAARR